MSTLGPYSPSTIYHSSPSPPPPPQLQGIKWIKTRYGADLQVIRLGQRGYMDVVEQAISGGSVVLIENIGESVDPVLDPLLARNLIRKGT